MSDKKDPRARLVELLGHGSRNFLDTGLTMHELAQFGQAEKLAASWCLQSREERRRRLRIVVQLSVELGHIRERTEFSARLAELAIESVIEGDWKLVEEWANHFAFNEEGVKSCARRTDPSSPCSESCCSRHCDQQRSYQHDGNV